MPLSYIRRTELSADEMDALDPIVDCECALVSVNIRNIRAC